jgi:hypothetical protein
MFPVNRISEANTGVELVTRSNADGGKLFAEHGHLTAGRCAEPAYLLIMQFAGGPT